MLSEFFIFGLFLVPIGAKRPNFVVVLTDDQDVVLNGMTPMNKTRKYIGDEGVVFENAFTTSPICCPSRSSILTGLYIHNHGTINNSLSGGCSSAAWQKTFEPRTFGALLRGAGYRTFYAGKYLNQYGHKKSGGVEHVPEGWDWWLGLVGNSVYYNYTLSINGTKSFRGDTEKDYLTDVLKEYSLEFLKTKAEPFLMVVSTPAPHEPFTPANRHMGKFSTLKAPRTPNFNRVKTEAKHWLLRLPPDVLPPDVIKQVDLSFRNRWETLLAVDEMVESIINALEVAHFLGSTYVIYVSDNGFHLGQFAMPWDKRQPYETDIRIPLMMTGPQVPKNHVITHPVLNIDLAPTILELAGVESPYKMDGESFFPAVNSIPSGIPRREFLVEYRGEGEERTSDCYDDPNVKLCSRATACKCFDARNNTYCCIRSFGTDLNELYCKFQDGEQYKELYDLNNDPYQMNNLIDAVGGRVRKYDDVLECCGRAISSGTATEKCSII